MSLEKVIADVVRDTVRSELDRVLGAAERRAGIDDSDRLLFTEKHTAKMVSVSPLTLRDWRLQGRIAPKINRRKLIRYSRKNLDELIEILADGK